MRKLPRPQKTSHFTSDERGVSAVEFALTLPVMLALFVGVTEVGQAVSISRKVTITARTITDLVTQNTSVSPGTLQTLLQASAQTIAPYPAANVTITVSELQTDLKTNQTTVVWSGSYPNNSNALAAGSTFVLPPGLPSAVLPAGSTTTEVYLVYGQAMYSYTPVMGYKIIGPMGLSDHIYLSPRNSPYINYTN